MCTIENYLDYRNTLEEEFGCKWHNIKYKYGNWQPDQAHKLINELREDYLQQDLNALSHVSTEELIKTMNVDSREDYIKGCKEFWYYIA